MDCTKTDQRELLHPTIPKFINLAESAANQTVNFVQLDEFTEAYKTAYLAFKNKDEGVRPPLAGSSLEAEKIRNIVHKGLLTGFKEDIDQFIESENLDQKFRTLDEIKLELNHLPESERAWRPPGDAEKHMEPFTKACKITKRDSLLRQVRAERDKLNVMKSRVEVSRKRTVLLNESVQHKKAARETVIGSKVDLVAL